ncbi:hypothetical protein C8F01DRAFT_1068234 [Mycena amicta]|nr:hypothetical protein C8F01DRAFT_1068234 [Mycena amicta]
MEDLVPIQVVFPRTTIRPQRHLIEGWTKLLPLLEGPWTLYREQSYGKPPVRISPSIAYFCGKEGCPQTSRAVNCLYPTPSPLRPQIAVSMDLLELYRALFERSCDAITALAHGLRTVYERCGFRLMSTKREGVRAADALRQSLTQAVLWSSNLRDRTQRRLEALLRDMDSAPGIALSSCPPTSPVPQIASPTASASRAAVSSSSSSTASPTSAAPGTPALTPGRADRLLRDRCPLCFGGEEWGRPLDSGGDVQLGGDACFSYRHLRSAGDGPTGYNPRLFVPKAKVDAVKSRMDSARKGKPGPMLDDGCSESWNAANEKKKLVDPKRYDASGIFALTCRRSQVIFMVNVDTSGEQHHYIVALLEEVISHLPPEATICQAYDIGCVVDHTLKMHDILKPGVRQRISFVLNAMHAYGHIWRCQILYSPRMRIGMGLSDFEGVERYWSRIRKLIPITRGQWNSRRIWTLEKYGEFVNEDGIYHLGDWLVRQQTQNLRKRWSKANATLLCCGVPLDELRRQWEDQKQAQTSAPRHTPKRLQQELDKVIGLQTQIDLVEKSITDVRKSITPAANYEQASSLLAELETTHADLGRQAESLYESLNIHEAYPVLQGLPAELAHLLLTMRELKGSIQKRAIGSFLEWETLDQAVNGRREALGSSTYQSTRKAIGKRTPALLKQIKKYNEYCAKFQSERPEDCLVPIPRPLPTQLIALRSDYSLQEDIWTTPTDGRPPRWVTDEDVREGIRALHSYDRCKEEHARLQQECSNMQRWLSHELALCARVVEACPDPSMRFSLHEHQERLRGLQASWARGLGTPLPPFVATEPLPPSVASGTESEALVAACLSSTRMEFEEPEELLESEVALFESLSLEGEEELTGEGLDVDSVAEVLLGDDCGEDGQDDCGGLSQLSLAISTVPVSSEDLHRLKTPSWLNNFVLNAAVSAILLRLVSAPRLAHIAVLNTADFHRVQMATTDAVLWQHLAPTAYWEKAVWIVPIHQPRDKHWVLAAVVVSSQTVFFYDSLAKLEGWESDLNDTLKLMSRMWKLAQDHQHDIRHAQRHTHDLGAWKAVPLFDQASPQQSNGHDCGVWVICMIAAIARGFSGTEISEADIPHIRKLLGELIRTFPLHRISF